MKLSNAFSLLVDIRQALQIAIAPTFLKVLKNPLLLFQPRALSRLFMAEVWVFMGRGIDDNTRVMKGHLITPNAHGVVLDIGAGFGHTAQYLDQSKVTKYVALEPNTLMHPNIRAMAAHAGFKESDGSLLILSCGAEDTASIINSLGGAYQPIDSIVSILTFCSVPSPEQTLHGLVQDLLKPGGVLVFYEHVLSHRDDVAWWQRFWAPLWQIFFDGCRLDRPTHLWVDKMINTEGNAQNQGMWRERSLWGNEGEPEEHMFWHQSGKFIKR